MVIPPEHIWTETEIKQLLKLLAEFTEKLQLLSLKTEKTLISYNQQRNCFLLVNVNVFLLSVFQPSLLPIFFGVYLCLLYYFLLFQKILINKKKCLLKQKEILYNKLNYLIAILSNCQKYYCQNKTTDYTDYIKSIELEFRLSEAQDAINYHQQLKN
jgi:hypothetical protein